LITNREAGTNYQVKATVTSLTGAPSIVSAPITVVPGLAAIFSFRGWQGIEGEPQPLPADEMSYTLFSLQVKD